MDKKIVNADGKPVGRDDKGRFVEGVKATKKRESNPELNFIKKHTYAEISKCAHSLTRPWKTLKNDLTRDDSTRLEWLTANAINTKNYKFIQWLAEMAVGRPKQTIEADFEGKNEFTLKYKIDEE